MGLNVEIEVARLGGDRQGDLFAHGLACFESTLLEAREPFGVVGCKQLGIGFSLEPTGIETEWRIDNPGIAKVETLIGDAGRRALECHTQPLLVQPERLFHLLTLAYIANDRGDEKATAGLEGAEADLDGELVPIFVEAI